MDDGDAVRLCGRCGPQPDTWGLFLGLYAVSLFSALAGLVLGGSQALLGIPAWGLLVAAGSALFGGVVYLGSFVGQRLSAHQMHVLGDFLTEAAGAPLEPEPELSPSGPRAGRASYGGAHPPGSPDVLRPRPPAPSRCVTPSPCSRT